MSKSLFNTNSWSIKPVKLAVLVPVRDTVHSVFAVALTQMVKTNTLAGIDTHVIFDASTILINQREKLAQQAVTVNADYCLWLDSDMTFPSTVAMRLMAHKQPIVAANYMKRANPLTTVAFEKIGDWDSWLPLSSEEELVEVEGIGMGCVLMETRLLTELEKPWFAFTYQEQTQDWMGEDFYFLGNLRKLGYKVLVDMNLSRQIRHIGNWAFGPNIGTNEEQIIKRNLINVER
jgi:hypothetical protein